jgi:LPS sulfotransferase NodH
MINDRYVIFCATQRTGSTLIFDDVRNLMGCPVTASELLYLEVFRRQPAKPWAAIIEHLRRENRVQDLVMAKVMFHYTPYLSAAIDGIAIEDRPPVYRFEPELFDSFRNFFRDAIWVHISRQDVYAQAVSIYFAEATNLWHQWKAGAEVVAAGTERRTYDRTRLLRYLENLLIERACWQVFFEHYGISPLCLSYEDAVVSYPGYLNELLMVTGLRPIAPTPDRRMVKVGDATNTEFARLLREDAQAELSLREQEAGAFTAGAAADTR